MLGGRSPIQGFPYNLSTPSCSLYSKELTRAALSPTHTPTPLHPSPPLIFPLPSSSRLPQFGPLLPSCFSWQYFLREMYFSCMYVYQHSHGFQQKHLQHGHSGDTRWRYRVQINKWTLDKCQMQIQNRHIWQIWKCISLSKWYVSQGQAWLHFPGQSRMLFAIDSLWKSNFRFGKSRSFNQLSSN